MQHELEHKVGILKLHSAVINALPKYLLITFDKAYLAAMAGAPHETLASMLTEEAQQAMKWYLNHDKAHKDPAPSTIMSENAWKAMVPCKVCGQAIGYHEPYATVIPAHTLGYICHVACIPKGTLLV